MSGIRVSMLSFLNTNFTSVSSTTRRPTRTPRNCDGMAVAGGVGA